MITDYPLSDYPLLYLRKDIMGYQIDDFSSTQKFSDRLAKEMMWSKEYTLRVIEEYKKFMFLAIVGKDPVTPSLEVDEVWHMHMLYSRSYKDFCDTFNSGRFIHHGPGRGGKEDEKFIDWYENTKQHYFMWFSKTPPEDIWPPSKVRFRHVHFARVDLLKNWVVSAGDWKGLLGCMWHFLKWKIKRLCGQL